MGLGEQEASKTTGCKCHQQPSIYTYMYECLELCSSNIDMVISMQYLFYYFIFSLHFSVLLQFFIMNALFKLILRSHSS